MVLAHIGWRGQPDDITRAWGKDYAQSPVNLGRLFNQIAQEHNLDGRLETRTNGSLEAFRQAAAAGEVLIVHGYFTGYSHVLVVTGFDGQRYTVNDPAGQWSERFQGGYAGMPEDGHGITYSRVAFEAAIATSDGTTFMPLWYHTLRRSTPNPSEGWRPAGDEDSLCAAGSRPSRGRRTSKMSTGLLTLIVVWQPLRPSPPS